MNAAEARKKRGASTLMERVMADPERAARIEKLAKAADIEQMVEAIMARQNVTAAELARRVNAKPPQISRDLHGGLRKATLARLAVIAEALDYEFVPVLVPRVESAQRDRFFEAYRALVPSVPEPVIVSESCSPTKARKKGGTARRKGDIARQKRKSA